TTDNINTEITDDLNLETTDNINTEITDDLNLETTDNINTTVTDDSNLETTDNINTTVTDDLNLETTDNINTEITDDLNLEITDNNITAEENKLYGSNNINQTIKNKFKEDFIDNLNKSYENLNNTNSLHDDLEYETEHVPLEEVKDENIIPTMNNEISSMESESNSNKSKIPYNTTIGIGLLIVFIGIIDIFTTVREYGYYIIVFGIIVVIVGIISYKEYSDRELRNESFRKNLLRLPNDFHIRSDLKLPNSDEIDHVIIGSTGIFSILVVNVENNFDKKIDISNEVTDDNSSEIDDNSTEEIKVIRNPQNIETNVMYTIGSSPLSHRKIEKIKKSKKINIKFNVNEKIKFDKFDKIKKDSIKKCETLINFLYENDFNYFCGEPLVGFINNKNILLNIPLTDDYVILDDFLNILVNSKIRFNDEEVENVSKFLSHEY
ncbi:MAG: NERD domain-containing protein, partial [Methanobrevibacter sp.]|nr:NERD domain-containing protein [Candidatus Methanovirga meridionalis]